MKVQHEFERHVDTGEAWEDMYAYTQAVVNKVETEAFARDWDEAHQEEAERTLGTFALLSGSDQLPFTD